MIEFKVFGKPTCGRCSAAKAKIEHLIEKHNVGGQVSLAYFNLDEPDGLAEAAMEGVTASCLGLPIVVVKIERQRMAIWDGRTPLGVEIVAFFPKRD
jgi:thioredoxin-like negative regulator of GroEL